MILCVIPARAGSKRLPGKNTRKVAGLSLVEWAFAASPSPGYGCETMVSTDIPWDELGDIPKADILARNVLFRGDRASTEVAVLECVDDYKERKGREPELVVVLQPTSPTRTRGDVEECLASFRGGVLASAWSGGLGPWEPDGGIYVTTPMGLRLWGLQPGKQMKYWGHREQWPDINDEEDLLEAERILKARGDGEEEA